LLRVSGGRGQGGEGVSCERGREGGMEEGVQVYIL
jgi:hypothetical protein